MAEIRKISTRWQIINLSEMLRMYYTGVFVTVVWKALGPAPLFKNQKIFVVIFCLQGSSIFKWNTNSISLGSSRSLSCCLVQYQLFVMQTADTTGKPSTDLFNAASPWWCSIEGELHCVSTDTVLWASLFIATGSWGILTHLKAILNL